ncbi:hypothetical protein FHR34_006997 [Kitasatospora kifunensis]|uniref:Uncharacterized protein n=1 Tax=Kitasatospora kifunensis TaxID=58351 RepID=A0A7W7R9F9_KITKI|nr:hypothetical protein [Kitasatospora kifunensis]
MNALAACHIPTAPGKLRTAPARITGRLETTSRTER